MELLFLVCAETGIVDVFTNRMSLFHVVEEMSSPAFPGIVPSLTVVSIFRRDADDQPVQKAHLRLTLNDQEIFKGDLDVRFEDKTRARNFAHLQGVPLTSPGTLLVTVLADDGNQLGSYLIPVLDTGKPKLEVRSEPVPSATAESRAGPPVEAKTVSRPASPSSRRKKASAK